MKFLILLVVVLVFGYSHYSNNLDISCMDGYLIYSKEISGFCKHAFANTNGIIGRTCYGVTDVSPRARIEGLTIKEGWYGKTKCYNADRE